MIRPVTTEEAAHRNAAIATALERLDEASGDLKRAEELIRDCRETFRQAGGSSSWTLRDGQVVAGLPISWPSVEEVVEALKTIERCRRAIVAGKQDLRKCGLDPSNWKSL